MERIIAIKNIMIEVKRNILHILNNRKDEIKMNVFTGYKSETAIELDNLNNKYHALSDELQAACLFDSTVYSGIVSSIDKEAETLNLIDRQTREMMRRSNQRMATALKSLRGEGGIASAEAAKAEIEAELIATKNIMTQGEATAQVAVKAEEAIIAPKEDTTVSENKDNDMTNNNNKEVVVAQEAHEEACMTTNSSKEDAEFWDLVEKEEAKKSNNGIDDYVKDMYGDLDALYNKTVTPEEIVIGEDEYININELTCESSEIWKPIKYTLYEISTNGRVRIAGTKKEVEELAIGTIKGKDVKMIFLDGQWMPLAKLVYAMFIEGGVKEVIHMDNNIHNNHILNLKAA